MAVDTIEVYYGCMVSRKPEFGQLLLSCGMEYPKLFDMVDYIREMTEKKSCKHGEHESF